GGRAGQAGGAGTVPTCERMLVRPEPEALGRRHVMRRRTPAPVAAAVLLLWCVGTTLAAAPSAQPDQATTRDRSADPTDRWIVVLKNNADAVKTSAAQGKKNGFTPDRLYRHALKGYAAHLNKAQLASVKADPSVAEVVPDEPIELESQAMPTGITRIG